MDKEIMLDKLSDIGLTATKEVMSMAIKCSFANFDFK